MTAGKGVSARASLSLESSVADRIRAIQAALLPLTTRMSSTSTRTMTRLGGDDSDDRDDREALRHGLDNLAEAFRRDAYYSDTESETDDV